MDKPQKYKIQDYEIQQFKANKKKADMDMPKGRQKRDEKGLEMT